MIILDNLLIGGLRFVLDKIASVVDDEMNDEQSLRQDLLAAQMQLELGEMDEEAFVALEREILARLREIREEQQAGGAVSLSDGGVAVDITFRGDENA
jgi:gas vesicle protein GvpG